MVLNLDNLEESTVEVLLHELYKVEEVEEHEDGVEDRYTTDKQSEEDRYTTGKQLDEDRYTTGKQLDEDRRGGSGGWGRLVEGTVLRRWCQFRLWSL